MVITELGNAKDEASLGGKEIDLEMPMGHPEGRELRKRPGPGKEQGKQGEHP